MKIPAVMSATATMIARATMIATATTMHAVPIALVTTAAPASTRSLIRAMLSAATVMPTTSTTRHARGVCTNTLFRHCLPILHVLLGNPKVTIFPGALSPIARSPWKMLNTRFRFITKEPFLIHIQHREQLQRVLCIALLVLTVIASLQHCSCVDGHLGVAKHFNGWRMDLMPLMRWYLFMQMLIAHLYILITPVHTLIPKVFTGQIA